MSVGVYRLLIFDRHYSCRLDRSWLTPPSNTDSNQLTPEDTLQLIMGMTYSLKNMLQKLSPAQPTDADNPSSPNASSSSLTYSAPFPNLQDYSYTYLCSHYRLLYHESPTGWKFVMLVEPCPASEDLPQILPSFYANVFLRAVIQNPLYRGHEKDFGRTGLLAKIDEFITSSSKFKLVQQT